MRYKTKYKSLSKEERNKLKYKYYNTKEGKVSKARLNRLFIYGIIGYIVSIYILVTDRTIPMIIISVVLLLASTLYLVSSFKLRSKELNNFLIKK